MNNDPEKDWPNSMLDAFKEKYPQFGHKPAHTAPVFRTDAERLESARDALREIMNIAFQGHAAVESRGNKASMKQIWDIANIALARTDSPLRCDTIP